MTSIWIRFCWVEDLTPGFLGFSISWYVIPIKLKELPYRRNMCVRDVIVLSVGRDKLDKEKDYGRLLIIELWIKYICILP